MIKKLSLMTAFIAICAYVGAQPDEFRGEERQTPRVNDNGTVTFRLKAPHARSVALTGDFLPPTRQKEPNALNDGLHEVSMRMNGDSVWEYTTDTLASELYNYYFIVDRLKTIDPDNVFTRTYVSSLMNIFIVPGGRGDLYSVREVSHGSVEHLWYYSPHIGTTRRMTVYTPAGYEDGGGSYPVLYLLHGMGGDEDSWTALGRAAQIIDNLTAAGKALPMIVVMPNGNVSQEGAPGETPRGLTQPRMMLPHTMDGLFEQSFPDIVGYVDSHYRTIAGKEGRAIAGLSMGGFHSKYISLEYPRMFDYIGLFSAAVSPPPDAGSEIYSDEESKLAVLFADHPRLYWIGIGSGDFLYRSNAEYRRVLDARHYPYTYMETEGGHTWRNWRVYLSDFATRIFK